MRIQRSFFVALACLAIGLTAPVSLAQQTQGFFFAGDVGAGTNLVVTSVSGPATAIHNQTISVTYYVKNQGDVASGPYTVGLYLTPDKTVDPLTDRLLKNVTVSTGLAPGESRRKTTKVLVQINGLSGNYFYVAVVGNRKKTSSKQVSIARYSLRDNNETVKDHKTGLIWQRTDDGKGRNWADAKKYCRDLTLSGKENWRPPRIDELETVVDYSQQLPAIDPVFDGHSNYYWSSSASVGDPDYAWVVSFDSGDVDADSKTDSNYVLCVRGGPFWPFDPSTHLQTPIEKPGTVLDAYWRYMWQKRDSGDIQLNWVQANAYCDGLVLDGYSDWRLPEVAALETIVDYGDAYPALSAIFDPRRPQNYWSSSASVGDPDYAWVVSFGGGYADADLRTNTHYVRCVRGGPESIPIPTVPGAPTGVTAIAGNAEATVGFTPPVSNGGTAISSYTVTSSPGGIAQSGPSSPITVTGLTNGTAYVFTVKATNAVGTGPTSSPSNSVTPATVPGAPTGVTATAGNAQATVSFTAPTSNGGSPIISYMVTSSPGGITKAGASSPIVMTGLTNGTAYSFTIKASNAVGSGPASGPSNTVTPIVPATVPGAPTGVSASGGDGQATVSFMAPTSNGGSPITMYTAMASPGGIIKTGTSSPITVTDLTNGTAYTFTVKATNAVGIGPASGPSNSITPVSPTTALIASYMSTAYQVENASLADDIKAIKRKAAAEGSLLSGATALKILRAKPPHVQKFVNASLNFIQITKITNTIYKQEIAKLFSNYQAQDLSVLPSLLSDIFSQTVIDAAIQETAIIPTINNIYALAIAQLNAM